MARTCYTISHEGYLTWIAKNIKDLAGYEQSEVIGKHFFDFITEKDHALILERRKNRPSGHVDEYKTFLKKKDGSMTPIRIKVLQTPENSVGFLDSRLEERKVVRDGEP